MLQDKGLGKPKSIKMRLAKIATLGNWCLRIATNIWFCLGGKEEIGYSVRSTGFDAGFQFSSSWTLDHGETG
jgi:hypothetical protein